MLALQGLGENLGGAVSRTETLRVGNFSGFLGDRFSAAKDMLDGEIKIDVLTGDYLAELTMAILWKQKQRSPSLGYASTFLRQIEPLLGTILDRKVKVVVNAGGLNPVGLAEELRSIAQTLSLSPKIAVVHGDDLLERIGTLQERGETLAHLDTGQSLQEAAVTPITANAYLGAWGIVEGLNAGADIVICPRVTDASLVVGPAAWWYGWGRQDLDQLAGAMVAGHIIECGPQCCGGNYSLFHELKNARYPGFPIAEIFEDGSSIITKQPGTGGLVSVGTVTEQLLYEIGSPHYLGPDVTARFDSIELSQEGPDRVRVAKVIGEPPPTTLKVALNYFGGYRNSMSMVLTGLNIESKAEMAQQMLFDLLGGRETFSQVTVDLQRPEFSNSPTNEGAMAHLRITVKDANPTVVGRRFSDAVIALALASYPGFFTTTPPSKEQEYAIYWPTTVPLESVLHAVRLPDGTDRSIPPSQPTQQVTNFMPVEVGPHNPEPGSGFEMKPLGVLCGARSGDKGGNANVGVWTWSKEIYQYLYELLDVAQIAALVPEAAGLQIRRHELPNLLGLNFEIIGLLGQGVASSTRLDAQAKGLGEYLRSRFVPVPMSLVPLALPIS